MTNLRRDSHLGSLLNAQARASSGIARTMGRVTSVGDKKCDVLLDGQSVPVPMSFTGGRPVAGARVPVNIYDGAQYEAVTPTSDSASARGAGLVVNVTGGGTGTGGSGSAYPLPHALSHSTSGSDTVTPASIGASVPADIVAAIASHVGAANPHTQYVLEADFDTLGDLRYLQLAGGTLSGTLTAQHVFPAAADTYDLGSTLKMWRKGYLSELDAVVFAKNTIAVTGGMQLWAKNCGTLPASLTAAATTCDFGQAMTPNDFLCSGVWARWNMCRWAHS